MKFVHIADIHFDAPFVNLADKPELSNLKRMEQRNIFKKVIEYIQNEKINNLFISGDLYESQYIRQSTIEYINNLFKQIPETKIYISPGNHDPITKQSYYKNFIWNKNVHIFNDKIEKIETPEANIYGYGFYDFYCNGIDLESLNIDNSKTNILIVHGTIDGSSNVEKIYNPISSKILKEKGFDYVAMGHIHKKSYEDYENQKIIYPGSLVALGFDEIGKHGMIVGELENGILKKEFILIDQKQFLEEDFDVTNIISNEELIEKLNELEINNDYLLKVNLVGKRNFEINVGNIYKLIFNNNIIKIKNNTKINYDLEKLANENTLTGLFVKEMINKLNNSNITEEERNIIENSIEIGLNALKY